MTTTQSSLSDATARKLGRSCFDRPLVIEAGAGTGKTAVLVSRVLYWCLGPGWELHQGAGSGEEIAARVCERVVAITFTEAATAEMVERVTADLARLHRGEFPVGTTAADLPVAGEDLTVRTRCLLTAVERLRISTIHSFCASLLREHALSIGLHPAFVIDQDKSLLEELVRESFEIQLPRLYGHEPDTDALLLAALGKGPQKIARLLQRTASQPGVLDHLPEDPYSRERLAPFLQELREDLAALGSALAEALQGSNRSHYTKKIFTFAEFCSEFLAVLDSETDLRSLCDRLAVIMKTGTTKEHIKGYASGKFGKNECKILDEGVRLLISERAASLQVKVDFLTKVEPEILPAACRLVHRLLPPILVEMRRQGVMTFNHLLYEAQRLLHNEKVCHRVAAGMDQLLVDEFQDTDPLQCSLLSLLLNAPQAPALFLVGDPKQSIYGWRSADLAAYRQFVDALVRRGGEVHPLRVNFRSVQAILDEVERAVEPVMVATRGLQPAFEALEAAPQHDGDLGFHACGRSPVEYMVAWDYPDEEGQNARAKTSADRARAIEALAIAEDLRHLHHAGQIKWRDVAILMRTATEQELYLQALRAAGIPYQVEGNRSYYRRREVMDAASMVRCIVDPNDQVALVAALRSPAVGIPDAAWLPLWRSDFPGLMSVLQSPVDRDALSAVEQALDNAATTVAAAGVPGMERITDWKESAWHAVQQIAQLRRSFRTETANRFVSRLRNGLLQEGTEAARFPGAHRLANLEAFFHQLEQALCSRDSGPQQVLRALRRAVQKQEDQADRAPGEEGLDAVRVMTIHKAKGLDFGHVYLVNSHATASRKGDHSDKILLQEGGCECRILGAESLGLRGAERQAQRVADAERVRLLYVAMTRPKQRLVVCGKFEEALSDEAKPPRSLADLLRHRFPSSLTAMCTEGASQAELHDAYGARWWIPRVNDDPSGTKDADSVALPLERIKSGIKQLRMDRGVALARQARPFHGVASGEGSHETLGEHRHRGEDLDDWNWAPHGRAEALAIGSLVHHAMEIIDLNMEPIPALQQVVDRLDDWGGAMLPGLGLAPELHANVLQQTRTTLASLDAKGMIHELFERREQILGREVPILLPGGPDRSVSGVMIGTLDLLYRDPATGQLVVADHKTDRVVDVRHLQELVEKYQPQGNIYCDAVAQAFPDEDSPRFELWFLTAGEIVEA